jgi:inositol-phosphate phosphatase/L-galactose 1-phosphate phosphatase/histidinol-phosphatase
MTEPCPPEFIDFAHRLADQTGEIIRRKFRTPLTVAHKPDASPVTEVDREAETAIRDMVRATYPEHGVIGEEFEAERPDADYVWVVDPLDGTKGFITGKPLFGTLIGLLRGGLPVLGLIDHPILRERWIGARGHATSVNGDPAQVRACASVSEAVLFTTDPDTFQGTDGEAFRRVRDTSRMTMYGGDCYCYGLLASGLVDLIVEVGLGPDDYFPMIAMIEEAGGVVTDWSGAPFDMNSDGRILVAGDEAVYTEALALLKG